MAHHRCSLSVAALLWLASSWAYAQGEDPYGLQVRQMVARLSSDGERERAGAAEALGFLRAYAAEGPLITALGDEAAAVRREAALALSWCGGRGAVEPLLAALDDPDWSVAQSAWVALTNLTSMELPFDALAAAGERAAQAEAWRAWWKTVPAHAPPAEALALLKGPINLALGCPVTASSTYKGPESLLTDGIAQDRYWQTKNVPFPQHCTIDLGEPKTVATVIVHQHHPGFVITEFGLQLSLDGQTFDEVVRRKIRMTPTYNIELEPRQARYVRLVSYANAQPTYPTTVHEIEVCPRSRGEQERGLRALGALGGEGATEAVLDHLEPLRAYPDRIPPSQRGAVQAGLRALGRLKDPAALPWLLTWLWETPWARYAADALGDLGDARAVPALVSAYPQYGEDVRGGEPPRVPKDDVPGFEWLDRMYETPYAIASALCRLPLDEPQNLPALRRIAPLFLSNLPQDFDGAILYEPESFQRVTAYLLDRAGLRQEACESAFISLGQPRRVPAPAGCPDLPRLRPEQIAPWLPALCSDPEDLPRLLALLEHKSGWVRVNVAKALAFLGDGRAVEPLATLLAQAKSEADYGYSGKFLDEEYSDPTPRFREAWARALGLLGATHCAGLLDEVANDEGSVAEVAYAAARALMDLGTEEALTALHGIAADHPIESVRQVAREALWLRGRELPEPQAAPLLPPGAGAPAADPPQRPDALVFIKGDNAMPNDYQSDFWRQTYITTDSGPTYRPGRNLYVLRPVAPDGTATPLTSFADGYVADVEVSWDADRVIFCHRGEQDPWWHLYEIDADGQNLRQLTTGPYHDVGPAYLPDGRIVFSSSRIGMRDEYHGYPCTALYVMQADGGDIRAISLNAGRDAEVCIGNDGRLVFSRLEVFYSRLKTEITIHSVEPDGTRDVVIYGPERRDFWHSLDVGPRGGDYDSNVYPLHRILRPTQPQAMPDGRIVCATQGGLCLIGPDRESETIIEHDTQRAFTTPFPLPDGTILCASTIKESDEAKVDLGIYEVDPSSGRLAPVYNDPATADYEARPLMARRRPPRLAHVPPSGSFTGRFVCTSTATTQEAGVEKLGRLVRVVEGQPVVSRYASQTNGGPVWRNHGGTVARVLGTVPQAADGSFFVEVPADRMVHFQALDSDRQVVATSLTWVYVRPGETRSCVGCHERTGTTPLTGRAQAVGSEPVRCLPAGDELRYRAKVWFKGTLPEEAEARTRTVRAANLHARH